MKYGERSDHMAREKVITLSTAGVVASLHLRPALVQELKGSLLEALTCVSMRGRRSTGRRTLRRGHNNGDF